MNIPPTIKYTQNDEWVKVEGKIGIMGITDFAQSQLSDVVYVEIVVAVGDAVEKGDTCATVESVKAAADVYLPISGKVVAVNEALPDAPDTINKDPYGEAWMIQIELSDPGELDGLLTAAEYEKQCAEKG